MSSSQTYQVTLSVEVHDEVALLKAAREKAELDGSPADIVEDVPDALRWLFDPGAPPPGVEILDSAAERCDGTAVPL